MAEDQGMPILASHEPFASSPGAVVPSVSDCRIVSDSNDLAAHLAIRQAVFRFEQAIFSDSDRDHLDEDPTTVHVLAWSHAIPVGTVRLYPLAEPGRWKGDRLAVLRRHRGRRSAEALVCFAVRCAAERGGLVMEAQVQLPNVKFFSYLGWRATGPPECYLGRLHQAMIVDL